MSLESEIAKLAEAINANTAAILKSLGAQPQAETAAPEAEKKRHKSTIEKKVEAGPAAEIKPETPPATDAPKPVTIDTLRAIGSKVIAAGKSGQLKELLAKHQVEKLSQLPATAYNDVHAELSKLTA